MAITTTARASIKVTATLSEILNDLPLPYKALRAIQAIDGSRTWETGTGDEQIDFVWARRWTEGVDAAAKARIHATAVVKLKHLIDTSETKSGIQGDEDVDFQAAGWAGLLFAHQGSVTAGALAGDVFTITPTTGGQKTLVSNTADAVLNLRPGGCILWTSRLIVAYDSLDLTLANATSTYADNIIDIVGWGRQV